MVIFAQPFCEFAMAVIHEAADLLVDTKHCVMEFISFAFMLLT